MQVIVNGLLTQYDIAGKGKLLVILHGWGDNSSNWRKLQKQLADNYKVIMVDLPGFGGTAAPDVAWQLNDYAEFIRDFLKKVKVANVYAIIGHSNGGAITIRGLAMNLLRADKLILLGSAGIRGEYKGRNKALRYITKAGKAATMPLPKTAKKALRQKVYKSIGSDMLVAEHMQETFKNIVEDDVRADASKVMVPTLLIYGSEDTATPPRFGSIFQKSINNATFETVQDAGHFVYQDSPEETGRLIGEFLL